MKKCWMCKTEKPIQEFYSRWINEEDVKQDFCKSCAREYKKTKGGNYPYHKKSHKLDYRKGLIRAARHRAKQKNIPFDISWEDLELIDTCPIFGTPIYSDGPNNDNAPSIDRLIPELGYIKGNVFIMSRRANVIKNNASVEELEKIVNYINLNKNGNIGYE